MLFAASVGLDVLRHWKAQGVWLVERGKYDENEASVGRNGFVSDRC